MRTKDPVRRQGRGTPSAKPREDLLAEASNSPRLAPQGIRPTLPSLARRANDRHLNLLLLERLILLAQERRRDLQLQDLVGPLVDATDAHVHQVPARAIERGPAAAAEDLHGVVGRFP